MRKSILFLSLLASVMFFMGCKKEKVKGCTDKEAENYNALAEESDGSCTYARTKFIGSFEGNIKCGFPLNTDSEFKLDISEDLSSKSKVEIQFKETAIQLPILKGSISGSSIQILKDTIKDVELASLPGIKLDLVVSGSGEMTEDKTKIDGVLNVSNIPDSGQQPIVSSCNFDAVKK